MIDDAELARRSILGFGEMIATLGRWGVGVDAEVRRPDALGARIDALADIPWFDAAVVPPGVAPPPDGPGLPHWLWTLADAVPGRVERPEIATPCLGVALDDPAPVIDEGAAEVGTPSLAVLGEINDRAYEQTDVFAPLVRGLRDERARTHGLRDGDAFVCVALTLALGDDLAIHYVATEAGHRRRGLASRLLRAILAAARGEGRRSATLQASPDGLSVYRRLGFRHVATMRGYVRPDVGIPTGIGSNP